MYEVQKCMSLEMHRNCKRQELSAYFGICAQQQEVNFVVVVVAVLEQHRSHGKSFDQQSGGKEKCDPTL